MTSQIDRLLQPEFIPDCLWESKQKTLSLVPKLRAAYCESLRENDLEELAKARDPKNPPVGGASRAQSREHFAQAFGGSAARAQLALIDPENQLSSTSDHLVLGFAGNKVLLVDTPCGAGAAGLGILTSLAQLRADSVLPRQPLDVFLLGADISDSARHFANQMYSSLRHLLEEQAIFVRTEFLMWDVTDALSTTDLIRYMNRLSTSYPKNVLVVANFNAVLEKQKKRKKAEPQLEELFRHASGSRNRALWIEPAMNRATSLGGLFDWLLKLVEQGWRYFARYIPAPGTSGPLATYECKFRHPLDSEMVSRVRVALLPIGLVRKDEGSPT
jgi:hypothetical protein